MTPDDLMPRFQAWPWASLPALHTSHILLWLYALLYLSCLCEHFECQCSREPDWLYRLAVPFAMITSYTELMMTRELLSPSALLRTLSLDSDLPALGMLALYIVRTARGVKSGAMASLTADLGNECRRGDGYTPRSAPPQKSGRYYNTPSAVSRPSNFRGPAASEIWSSTCTDLPSLLVINSNHFSHQFLFSLRLRAMHAQHGQAVARELIHQVRPHHSFPPAYFTVAREEAR